MPLDGPVKLTNENTKWLIIRVGSGFFTVKKAAAVYWETERRVQHLVKTHRDTGVIPRLNPNRQPKTSLSADHKAAIEKAWEETRLGARLLFCALWRRGHYVPHNKIHGYLQETGEACRIRGSSRKESDTDTNASIRVIWYTATGIGPLKTIRTRSYGSKMRRACMALAGVR